MGKRISRDDLIVIALLYRKIYVGTDMISYDKVCKFDLEIDKKLDIMSFECGFNYECDNKSRLYFKVLDENGRLCVILNPNVNVRKEWNKILGYLPVDICLVLELNDILKCIDLVDVAGEIRDINAYYNELREKYHLYEEFGVYSKFDIFRDWENITVDGYVEYFCISDKDRDVLLELRGNRDKNMESFNQRVKRLVRVKK